ncbi:MAG: SRPBCC family protein [Actinomycetota bacterium]
MYGSPLEAAMTRAISIITTIDISRPPEAVWPYLVDWEHLDLWMKEARGFKVVGEQREGVGVEAEATIRIAGITTHDTVRVTKWEPPAVLEIAHLGWVKGSGYMELSPTEKGCSMFWREELYPPWGPLGRIGLTLMTPTMRHVFQRDLRLLKSLVEDRA